MFIFIYFIFNLFILGRNTKIALSPNKINQITQIKITKLLIKTKKSYYKNNYKN